MADDDFFSSRQDKVAVSAAWSGLFAASAIVGFKRVRDCRATKGEMALSVSERVQATFGIPAHPLIRHRYEAQEKIQSVPTDGGLRHEGR